MRDNPLLTTVLFEYRIVTCYMPVDFVYQLVISPRVFESSMCSQGVHDGL